MEALTVREEGSGFTVRELTAAMQRQSDLMASMAMMLKASCEKVDRLEKEVRRLEKLTPMQVTEMNALIRKRARDLTEEYGLAPVHERTINTWIRAELKQEFGGIVKEISRCDRELALGYIRTWENSGKLLNLKGGKYKV